MTRLSHSMSHTFVVLTFLLSLCLTAHPFNCAGPAEIIERKVAPDGSVSYYVHYMDCESYNLPHVYGRLLVSG